MNCFISDWIRNLQCTLVVSSHVFSWYVQTDKASMLDEIIGYVKFLQMQVKVVYTSHLIVCVYTLCIATLTDFSMGHICGTSNVSSFILMFFRMCFIIQCLSMCRLGGAGATAPLLADLPVEVNKYQTFLCEQKFYYLKFVCIYTYTSSCWSTCWGK